MWKPYKLSCLWVKLLLYLQIVALIFALVAAVFAAPNQHGGHGAHGGGHGLLGENGAGIYHGNQGNIYISFYKCCSFFI